jgi:hypothetical protein
MDRKNINRGFKLIQKTFIQTLKLRVFDHYFYPVKPFFSVSLGPLFQHSIIPCRRHKTTDVKRCMISIYYRSSETYIYCLCLGAWLFFPIYPFKTISTISTIPTISTISTISTIPTIPTIPTISTKKRRRNDVEYLFNVLPKRLHGLPCL